MVQIWFSTQPPLFGETKVAGKDNRNCIDDQIVPNPLLTKVKMLGSLPGMIKRYALSEEQALLTLLRYNRLVDVFTGTTCYSLDNHLRTSMPAIGDVETDEIYLGIGNTGRQFVFPVQARGRRDHIRIVQTEQDLAVCASRFPTLDCRPIGAQLIEEDLIALFEFERSEGEISIKAEKHYRIVPNEDLSDDEILAYRSRGSCADS